MPRRRNHDSGTPAAPAATNTGRTQRQLKVGEELRHVIASVLIRESFHDPDLDNVPVTVSEVRVSADFANAAVYIVPPQGGGGTTENVLAALTRLAPSIQSLVASRVAFKRMPRLEFLPDTSFAHAERIDSLIDGAMRK